MTIAMSRLRSVLSASVLSLALVMPAAANGPGPAPTGPQVSPISGSAALQPCPSHGKGINLAEVSQADCCKGHQGVCGCRAGKIVCCDNTISPNCTCHADSGIEN